MGRLAEIRCDGPLGFSFDPAGFSFDPADFSFDPSVGWKRPELFSFDPSAGPNEPGVFPFDPSVRPKEKAAGSKEKAGESKGRMERMAEREALTCVTTGQLTIKSPLADAPPT